jgi:hypothetical protein
LARRARDVAVEVARRATDVDLVADACAVAATQTAYPSTVRWAPGSVAQGDAGLALLAGQLDAYEPGVGWDVVAHHFLAVAARDAERASTGSSLFSGLAGLGLAAALASRDGQRYRRLLAAVDEAVAVEAISASEQLRNSRAGIPVAAFDAISGLAGVGVYLLLRRDNPTCRAALEETLRGLVALAEPAEPPRWWTPAQLFANEAMARRHPHGSLNCGLAHGIPGPLALLALASLEGVTVSGQANAVHSIAEWLVQHRVQDAWGVNWPNAVAVASAAPEGIPGLHEPPGRAAWCYGGPGVARSLWLAGRALEDASLLSLAVSAMESVYARPVAVRHIDSPTFCHGIAGLLQITLRFSNDTDLPVFAAAAAALTEQLLSCYAPQRLLGFCSVEPDGRTVDQPGLLDGAPGIALALLAASTAAAPSWDRLFLLA